MTNTAVLTPDAQAYLERYLRKVRAALRGHPSVDTEDVERDVIGHVSAELGSGTEPVTVARLEGVLERLGSPDQWISADELPLWRRVMLRVRTGPEDWRLAYLTLALWTIGPILGPVGPLFLFASIPVARATIALIDDQGDDIGARRWLVYPPLVLIYAGMVSALIGWPLPLVAGASEGLVRGRLPLSAVVEPLWLTIPGLLLAALGLWWVVLGLISARITRVVHAVFHPFAGWFEKRHAQRLAIVGFVMFAIGATLLMTALKM